MIISSDLEWGSKINVLGLAWDDGLKATATFRNETTLPQYLAVLRRADVVVMQNGIDADCRQLAAEGIDVSWLEPKVYDIRLAMHAVNSHLAGTGSFDLRSILLLLGSRQGKRYPLDWKDYAHDILKTCAMDASAAAWAMPTLDRQIKNLHLDATLAISHQCAPIFARMRLQGVRLDRQVLETIHKARKEKTAQIIEQYHLWEERGKKVIKKVPIWRSNKILDIFQEKFGIRPKDRQRQTWVKLLAIPSLSAEAREFAEAIIDLGEGANDAHWLGAITEAEDGTIDFNKVSKDGFIHPYYDICGSPDRAIASGPNIQNFVRPKDDPRPTPLRAAVIGLYDGHVLLACDYSAVETITNAIESHDWDRVRAVLEKRITHEGTAATINQAFGLSLNRHQGKAINHGFDKGESPYNLARTLFGTERPSRQQVDQCRIIFQKMLVEYPKTAKFRNELWERASENPLTVSNSFGRRLMSFSRSKYGENGEQRFAKHDPAKKYWCSCSACAPRRDRWKYAISFLGRSSAFDALLRAMSRVWYEKRLDAYSLPIAEVHDSLMWSVPQEAVDRYAPIAVDCMQEIVPELGISLPCDTKIGRNWAECS